MLLPSRKRDAYYDDAVADFQGRDGCGNQTTDRAHDHGVERQRRSQRGYCGDSNCNHQPSDSMINNNGYNNNMNRCNDNHAAYDDHKILYDKYNYNEYNYDSNNHQYYQNDNNYYGQYKFDSPPKRKPYTITVNWYKKRSYQWNIEMYPPWPIPIGTIVEADNIHNAMIYVCNFFLGYDNGVDYHFGNSIGNINDSSNNKERWHDYGYYYHYNNVGNRGSRQDCQRQSGSYKRDKRSIKPTRARSVEYQSSWSSEGDLRLGPYASQADESKNLNRAKAKVDENLADEGESRNNKKKKNKSKQKDSVRKEKDSVRKEKKRLLNEKVHSIVQEVTKSVITKFSSKNDDQKENIASDASLNVDDIDCEDDEYLQFRGAYVVPGSINKYWGYEVLIPTLDDEDQDEDYDKRHVRRQYRVGSDKVNGSKGSYLILNKTDIQDCNLKQFLNEIAERYVTTFMEWYPDSDVTKKL